MLASMLSADGRSARGMAASVNVSPEPPALPLSLVTTALWLSLWVAAGSLTLAVADGLGSHPGRRLLAGALPPLILLAAFKARRGISVLLGDRPWLVLPIAAGLLVVVAIDGVIGSPYIALTPLPIGFAVIVGSPRIVWSCVALRDRGYLLGGMLASSSPGSFGGDLAGVLGEASRGTRGHQRWAVAGETLRQAAACLRLIPDSIAWHRGPGAPPVRAWFYGEPASGFPPWH